MLDTTIKMWQQDEGAGRVAGYRDNVICERKNNFNKQGQVGSLNANVKNG